MSKLPEPVRLLSERIRKIEEQLRRVGNASAFAGTGVHPNGADGLDSDNYVEGVSGFSLNGATGNAEFNDIILRDIPNSALANPVIPAVGHGQSVDFSVTPTLTHVASVTISVPSGYTRAMVTATATASAFNPTTTSDYIYVRADIASDTSPGWSMPQGVPPSDSAATSQTATALLTGLSGSFVVSAAVASGSVSFTTQTSGNVANIDATVFFLR